MPHLKGMNLADHHHTVHTTRKPPNVKAINPFFDNINSIRTTSMSTTTTMSPPKLYPLPSKTAYSVPKPIYHNRDAFINVILRFLRKYLEIGSGQMRQQLVLAVDDTKEVQIWHLRANFLVTTGLTAHYPIECDSFEIH